MFEQSDNTVPRRTCSLVCESSVRCESARECR